MRQHVLQCSEVYVREMEKVSPLRYRSPPGSGQVGAQEVYQVSDKLASSDH